MNKDFFPQVIILSMQRSGTHLLQSFLTKHQMINGRGEVFLKVQREEVVNDNEPGKINVGILMYNQLNIFRRLQGNLNDHKIIHLTRNAYDVALSRLQMESDKAKLGNDYRAHFHLADMSKEDRVKSLNSRVAPDHSELEKRIHIIEHEQKEQNEILRDVEHLKLTYEEIAINNESVKYLDENVQDKLLRFLGLPLDSPKLYTTYLKTGIVSI